MRAQYYCVVLVMMIGISGCHSYRQKSIEIEPATITETSPSSEDIAVVVGFLAELSRNLDLIVEEGTKPNILIALSNSRTIRLFSLQIWMTIEDANIKVFVSQYILGPIASDDYLNAEKNLIEKCREEFGDRTRINE